jgi:hypothetical protein
MLDWRIRRNSTPRRREEKKYSCLHRKDLEAKVGAAVVKNGWGHAIRPKWIQFDKKSGLVQRLKSPEEVEDTARSLLEQVAKGDNVQKKDLDGLKKRTFVSKSTSSYFEVW